MFIELRLWVAAMEAIVCVHLTTTVGSSYEVIVCVHLTTTVGSGYSLCSLNYGCGYWLWRL